MKQNNVHSEQEDKSIVYSGLGKKINIKLNRNICQTS